MFQNGSFPLPVPEAQGNLSPIPVLTVENLVELLRGKIHKSVGGLDDWVLWSFSLSLVHGEPPAIHHV